MCDETGSSRWIVITQVRHRCVEKIIERVLSSGNSRISVDSVSYCVSKGTLQPRVWNKIFLKLSLLCSPRHRFIFCIITPVFSLTCSFKNMLIWQSQKFLSVFKKEKKKRFCCNILVEIVILFSQDSLINWNFRIENYKSFVTLKCVCCHPKFSMVLYHSFHMKAIKPIFAQQYFIKISISHWK